MNILIVGAGGVGFSLAETLANEGHQVTIVDTRTKRVEEILEKIDIQGLVGNGVSHEVLLEAGVKEADLTIAVTEHDEVNLLCCLVAKKIAPNCQTIARVRNPIYAQEMGLIREELGLSMFINPEYTTANELYNLIQVPNAMNFESFVKGRVGMIQLQIPEGSPVHNMSMIDFSNKISKRTLIAILERHATKEIIIPNGETVLQEKDRIYVVTPGDEMNQLFRRMGFSTKPSRKVMIAGGGRISYYLALRLLRAHNSVTIIEKDPAICEELSISLPQATIINGDAIDRSLLNEEGLEAQDVFVALTDMDEENIMLSMYVGKTVKARQVTKVSTLGFSELMEDLPIGSVINPKEITAHHITRYVRAMANSSDSSNIESLYYLANRRVEAMEFYVKADSPVTGKTFSELRIKPNILVCCIYRKGQAIIPSGRDSIEKGDTVILVNASQKIKSIEDILM